MNSGQPQNYWDLLAGQFQHQHPPLRPCSEDIRIYEHAMQPGQSEPPRSRTRALLLGVTPEIVGLAWPAGTDLLAAEKSQPMIDRFWPGNLPGRRQVVRENWFNLKLEDHSLDLVVGDGVLTSLNYPDQYCQLARLISRWLKPEGRLILRVFARPPKPDSWTEILADLKAARISKFDILKWRLAMVLQKDIREGVVLNEVYRAWATLEREHALLLSQAGWPRATMDTIKLYDGRMERYTFPTVEELDEAFLPVLQRVSWVEPGYDFGHCCPIVSYAPTRSA